MPRRVQVIGAHSADFVWRAGGAVAKAVSLGGTAEVIALSYGERGESGELWKQEGQTVAFGHTPSGKQRGEVRDTIVELAERGPPSLGGERRPVRVIARRAIQRVPVDHRVASAASRRPGRSISVKTRGR